MWADVSEMVMSGRVGGGEACRASASDRVSGHAERGRTMPASLMNVRLLRADNTALPSEPPPADRVRAVVDRVLDGTQLCAWATVGPGETAHVNIGYFAHSDELHLYLLSHPGSLHSRNLASNATMAVAVFASTQGWTEPGRGIQLFGTCGQVGDSEVSDPERIYRRRYPAYGEWTATLTAADPARDYRFYRFIPARLKILDETEFGDAVFVAADIVRAS